MHGVNSAPTAFKTLFQHDLLCIAMIGKRDDICNITGIKENQTSQRQFGQGANWYLK